MLFTTALEPYVRSYFVPVYVLKTLLVTGALIYCRRDYADDIRFDARVLLPAVVVGLLVFWEWIPVSEHTPHVPLLTAMLGKRTAIDPFRDMAPALKPVFFFFRFFGMAVTVPFMEELFWRSFLVRYFTDPDRWEKLPIGQWSTSAFWIVVAGFAFVHPEWLAALICGVAYGLLLRQTKSLFASIVAHGVTNFVLAAYVVHTHQWMYW